MPSSQMQPSPHGSGNPEDRNIKKARRLLKRLLPDAQAGFQAAVPEQEETTIFVGDVEFDIFTFSTQRDFCVKLHLHFPCLEVPDGDPIPIDFARGAEISEIQD